MFSSSLSFFFSLFALAALLDLEIVEISALHGKLEPEFLGQAARTVSERVM